jgi:hypothetical protein
MPRSLSAAWQKINTINHRSIDLQGIGHMIVGIIHVGMIIVETLIVIQIGVIQAVIIRIDDMIATPITERKKVITNIKNVIPGITIADITAHIIIFMWLSIAE